MCEEYMVSEIYFRKKKKMYADYWYIAGAVYAWLMAYVRLKALLFICCLLAPDHLVGRILLST